MTRDMYMVQAGIGLCITALRQTAAHMKENHPDDALISMVTAMMSAQCDGLEGMPDELLQPAVEHAQQIFEVMSLPSTEFQRTSVQGGA